MQPVREVYSLLMPVHDGRIIVPRAAVAEVMGYSKPKHRPDDAPAFVLGYVEWQGQRIPLVSFEAARGHDVPELGRRTRIAVVFGIAGRLEPNVFAVVTQGYPYLVRVNENVLQREDMETDDPLVLARVRMANEKPFIPNLEKLEALIADALGIAPSAENAEADSEPVDELDALGVGEDFDAGLMQADEMDDVSGSDSRIDDLGANDAGVAVDLDEVTAFGTETNYSSELDELSGALEENDSNTDDGANAASVDLGEVTSFGTETNYSSELDELSDALQTDEGAMEEDEFSVDVSGFALDESETADQPDSDDNEIDLSGLEIDLDDDDKKD